MGHKSKELLTAPLMETHALLHSAGNTQRAATTQRPARTASAAAPPAFSTAATVSSAVKSSRSDAEHQPAPAVHVATAAFASVVSLPSTAHVAGALDVAVGV